MATRTGLAISTELEKHMCRVLSVYRPAMEAAFAQAVTDGKITAAQEATLISWMDAASAVCTYIRAVSGY